ncbi:hypothetical protein L218DRAFT_1010211 [Marasmius fiardii PR-910]|nr:hypothetical protein L218DRAFT_1010211 [Marasmius fiardii PR-910]
MPRRENELEEDWDDGVLDHVFLANANRRFPTSITAIEGLRRVGRPQVGSFNPKSKPGEEIETTLSIMVSLGMGMRMKSARDRQSTLTLIHQSWISLLGPRRSACTLRIRRYAYFCAFQRPPHTLLDDFQNLMHLFPRFRSFLAKVLAKVLDQGHYTWGLWAALITRLVHDDMADTATGNNWIFDNLQPFGHAFARQIHREVSRVPVMCDRELSNLYVTLVLLRPEFYGGESPLSARRVGKSGLQALVLLLSAFLRKRKRLTKPSGSDELSTVMTSLHLILSVMDGNFRVAEAVEAGLVVALVKADSTYFFNDLTPTKQRFDNAASRLLDRVSQYLAFPAVLHHFLRSVKALEKSDNWDDGRRLKKNSESMWHVWGRAKDKAMMFHIHPGLRDLRLRCSATGPTFKEGPRSLDHVQLVWTLFIAPGVVKKFIGELNIVTSVWVMGHYRNDGVPNACPSDSRFIQDIAEHFMECHSGQVTTAVKNYTTALKSLEQAGHALSEPKRLIVSRVKYPIVVIDLCTPGVTKMSDCTIVDSDELGTRFENRVGNQLADLTDTWKSSAMDGNFLFAVVLIPMGKDGWGAIGFQFDFLMDLWWQPFNLPRFRRTRYR